MGFSLIPKTGGALELHRQRPILVTLPKWQEDKYKRFVWQKQYAYLLCFIFERVVGCPVVFFIKDIVVRGDVKGTATNNTIDE